MLPSGAIWSALSRGLSGPRLPLGLFLDHPVQYRRRRSEYDELKQPAKRPSLSRFKAHMEWLKDLDDRFGASSVVKTGTELWLEGIPPAKIAHFAGEARVLDAAELRDFNPPKRLALLACLVHTTRVRGRDELAGMLIRRMATVHKKGREKLEEIRETERAETERLWKVFGDVLTGARIAIGIDEEHAAGSDTSPADPVAQDAGASDPQEADGADGAVGAAGEVDQAQEAGDGQDDCPRPRAVHHQHAPDSATGCPCERLAPLKTCNSAAVQSGAAS
jgi:hypothetical protein